MNILSLTLLVTLTLFLCCGLFFLFRRDRESLRYETSFLLCIFSFSAFLLIFLLQIGGYLQEINSFVTLSLLPFRKPIFTDFFVVVTALADIPLMTILSIFFVSLLFYLRDRNILPSLLAICFGGVFGLLLKNYLHVARPAFQLITESGFSFPSGHALMSTIFFALVYKDIVSEIRTTLGKFLLGSVSCLLILLICMSRVYLGVHFIGDVIAGFFLGIFFVSFWWTFFHRKNISLIQKSIVG